MVGFIQLNLLCNISLADGGFLKQVTLEGNGSLLKFVVSHNCTFRLIPVIIINHVQFAAGYSYQLFS